MIHQCSKENLESLWSGMLLERLQGMHLFFLKQKSMVVKHYKSTGARWAPAMLNSSVVPKVRFNKFSTLSATSCTTFHPSCCHLFHNSHPSTLLSYCQGRASMVWTPKTVYAYVVCPSLQLCKMSWTSSGNTLHLLFLVESTWFTTLRWAMITVKKKWHAWSSSDAKMSSNLRICLNLSLCKFSMNHEVILSCLKSPWILLYSSHLRVFHNVDGGNYMVW